MQSFDEPESHWFARLDCLVTWLVRIYTMLFIGLIAVNLYEGYVFFFTK